MSCDLQQWKYGIKEMIRKAWLVPVFKKRWRKEGDQQRGRRNRIKMDGGRWRHRTREGTRECWREEASGTNRKFQKGSLSNIPSKRWMEDSGSHQKARDRDEELPWYRELEEEGSRDRLYCSGPYWKKTKGVCTQKLVYVRTAQS